MLPVNCSHDWIPVSFRRIERVTSDYITDDVIERWNLSERIDTAGRILLSLFEQISILEASVFELIDSLELIRDLLGNQNRIQYDEYWHVVLSNDHLHLKIRIAVQVQNTLLWISFLNPMAQISSPEIRQFFEQCGRQLIRWGQGWYVPSDRARDLDRLFDHINSLKESIAHLTRVKARLGNLLRDRFSCQV